MSPVTEKLSRFVQVALSFLVVVVEALVSLILLCLRVHQGSHKPAIGLELPSRHVGVTVVNYFGRGKTYISPLSENVFNSNVGVVGVLQYRPWHLESHEVISPKCISGSPRYVYINSWFPSLPTSSGVGGETTSMTCPEIESLAGQA